MTDAATTQEERQAWLIDATLPGNPLNLSGENTFRLLRDLARVTRDAEQMDAGIARLEADRATLTARAEAAEKALAEVRNMAMGDALGRVQRIIRFIDQFQTRSQP